MHGEPIQIFISQNLFPFFIVFIRSKRDDFRSKEVHYRMLFDVYEMSFKLHLDGHTKLLIRIESRCVTAVNAFSVEICVSKLNYNIIYYIMCIKIDNIQCCTK